MNELQELKARLAQLEEQVKENVELKARLKKAETLNLLSNLNPEDWIDNKAVVVEVYGAELPVLKQVIADWGLEAHLPYKRVKKLIRESEFEDKDYIDRSANKMGPLVRRGSELHLALEDSVTREYESFRDGLVTAVINSTPHPDPASEGEE